MTTQPVSITVDPSMIDGVITKEIQGAIIAQCQKTPDLIARVVQFALKQKVSSHGTKSSYDYENKYDFIDVLCNDAIQENARIAVKEWIKNKAPEIQIAVKKALDAQKNKMTKQFADNIVNSLNANFHISCSLNLQESN